ncbi:MAG: hypothetical protein ACK5QC_12750 [Bacteroidota bacterium]
MLQKNHTTSPYHAFGMEMPGRKWTASDYRYGMNTQEKTPEIFEGSYGAKYWEYDSRIGRRWNMDPKPTTGLSDYACFANNPILNVDILGDKVKYSSARSFFHVLGARIMSKDYRKDFKQLKKSDDVYRFKGTSDYRTIDASASGETTFDPKNKEIVINFSFKHHAFKGDGKFGNLIHETKHGVQFDDGKFGFIKKDGEWVAANLDVIDETEAFLKGFNGPNQKDSWQEPTGYKNKKADSPTESYKFNKADMKRKVEIIGDAYGVSGKTQKVNSSTVKDSHNYFRVYDSKSDNPTGAKIERVDSRAFKPNTDFNWNYNGK